MNTRTDILFITLIIAYFFTSKGLEYSGFNLCAMNKVSSKAEA